MKIKIMRLFLFALVGILLGCATSAGRLKIEYELVKHDPYFDKYINGFKNLTNLDTSKIKIEFVSEMEDNVIGACYHNELGILPKYNYIKINKKFWFSKDGSPDLIRKALIYHELAHCIALYYDHANDISLPRSICQHSIMSPSIPANYCLERYWDYYLQELNDRIGLD